MRLFCCIGAVAVLVLSCATACADDDSKAFPMDSGSSGGTTATTATSVVTTSLETTAVTTTSVESSATTADTNDTITTTSTEETGPVDVGCAAGAVGDTTDGATDPLMGTWGARCSTHADCVALIGDPAAVCDTMAVIYELPGGYCTKPCTLPDLDTQFVLDAPDCDPDGGVACIGSKGTFERCGLVCTDDMQCNRDGYICRQMPLIAFPEDPRMCLMPDCCQDTCEK
jgi:hypothetical protein